jgi:hypothetical protein
MKKASLLLALLFVWISEAPADAYLDPGSGSMLIQLLLGGVAGAAVILKLGWHRLRDTFGGGSAPDETKSDE